MKKILLFLNGIIATKIFTAIILCLIIVSMAFVYNFFNKPSNNEKVEGENIRFYYTSTMNNSEKNYIDKVYTGNTEEELLRFFQENFSNPGFDDLDKFFPGTAMINSITIIGEYAVIDITKPFMDNNLGTEGEMSLLATVVNTIGDYYNVDKVKITIDKEQYASGHIEMTESDFFNVSINEYIKYK